MEKRFLAGYGLAAVSAVTYSVKGIFAKILYSYGVDPLTLLAFRYLIALPFFWALIFIYPSGKVSPRDLLYLVLSGLLGLYAATIADFYGLLYISASLERVILYTYPTMVMILTMVFFKERLGKRKLVSLVLTYAGLVLVLKIFGGGIRVSYIGAALVLFSAAVYSLSYILTEVLGRRISGVKISAYSTTAAAFACVATWHGRAVPEGLGPWTVLILLAVVSTFVPVLTLALGIKRIGAGRAAVVSFIGPVSTAVLANVILGESMEPVQIAGMFLVMAGVITASSGGVFRMLKAPVEGKKY